MTGPDPAPSGSELAKAVLDALETPTCAIGPDGTVLSVNAAWTRQRSGDDLRGRFAAPGGNYLLNCEQVPVGSPDRRAALDIAAGLRSVLSAERVRYEHEYAMQGAAGTVHLSLRITPSRIGGQACAVISLLDITSHHLIEQELAHRVMHDGLTGLPNRELLQDRIAQATADSTRRQDHTALAFLDLDDFKRINDSLGHTAGDDLLVQLAARLSAQLRAGDTLGRLAGDEFVLIWRDLTGEDQARVLGDRVLSSFEAPFVLGGVPVTMSASLGVAMVTADQDDQELLASADAAMYEAKRRGRGQLCLYDPELRRRARERLATEIHLRAGIEQSQLVLRYQPVIDLVTGWPVAVETLVRWEHPARGLLSPAQFIPLAEATGLMTSLGAWVLRAACAQAAAFTGAAVGLDVAVNLSARQLTDPAMIGNVRDALLASRLDPRRLILEVTESSMMAEETAAALALDELARLGVRIAVDDFGTGYSSLVYLRRYPISIIKLGKSFVGGLGLHDADDAICRSVIDLAKAVGATSIATGVETAEQRAALRALHCHQGQGLLWSPAVAANDLEQALMHCRTMTNPPGVAGPGDPTDLLPRAASPLARRLRQLQQEGATLRTMATALNSEPGSRHDLPPWTAASVAKHLTHLPS